MVVSEAFASAASAASSSLKSGHPLEKDKVNKALSRLGFDVYILDMPKRNNHKGEILSAKECLDKLISSAATLQCTAKALKELKMKHAGALVQEATEDILRVATVFQEEVIKQRLNDGNEWKVEVESK